jgi:hypothetical protein
VAVGEAFPTGPAFLLAKSSIPLKTPTVLSQQELGNPVGKAFANRVGVFANSLALLAKRAFPVVFVANNRDLCNTSNFIKEACMFIRITGTTQIKHHGEASIKLKRTFSRWIQEKLLCP